MSPWIKCLATPGDKNSEKKDDSNCRQRGVRVNFLHSAVVICKTSLPDNNHEYYLKEFLFYK